MVCWAACGIAENGEGRRWEKKRDRDWRAGEREWFPSTVCLLQQKPRGHVGCSRSGMSRIYWEWSRSVQNGIPCWEKAEIPMEERAAWSRSWVMQNHADYWSSSPEVELIRRCYAAKRQDESWRLRSRCVMFEIWWLSRSRSTLTSKVGGGEVVARLLCP